MSQPGSLDHPRDVCVETRIAPMSTYGPKTVQLKDGSQAVLVHSTQADASALLSFRASVYHDSEYMGTEPDEFTATLDEQVEWVQKKLVAPAQLAMIARVRNEIIGYLSCDNPSRRRLAHTGTIFMAVAKQWRGKGVGASLLAAAIEWAEVNPVLRRLALAVVADNTPAIALYRKYGFVEEGRCIAAIRLAEDCYTDDILMSRFVKH